MSSYKIDELKWINPYHGMELYEGFEPNKRDNENGVLFLAQYYFLDHLINSRTVHASYWLGRKSKVKKTFDSICNYLRTYSPTVPESQYKGLYDRGAAESRKRDKSGLKTISHDNLTAIAAFSYLFNLEHHKHIYEHGKRNMFRYDNVQPENPRWSRIMHPRDIIYYSRLGGSTISRLVAGCFMWAFYASQVVSCLRKYEDGNKAVLATSGKLLAFVRLYALRAKGNLVAEGVWRLCEYIIKRQGYKDFAEVFEYYFKAENHPNRIMAKEYFRKA